MNRTRVHLVGTVVGSPTAGATDALLDIEHVRRGYDPALHRWTSHTAAPLRCRATGALLHPANAVRPGDRVAVVGTTGPDQVVDLHHLWPVPAAAATDDVWVVVPAYNEAAAIGDVLTGLRARFEHVLVVDDGSRDQCAAVAAAHGAVVVSHPVNLGQGAALATGIAYVLRHTDAGFLVTFDGDGQHAAEDAADMLTLARAGGFDAVLGSRFLGDVFGQPARRTLLLRAAVWFSRRVTGLPLTDTHNGLRVLSRAAASRLHLTHNSMAYASELEAQVAAQQLRWLEAPTAVAYTDYSTGKGQPNLNAVNIVYDLLLGRIRAAR